MPWLYLKGISTGDFALASWGAPRIHDPRLKEVWGVEAERWQRRPHGQALRLFLAGIYFSARMEEEKQCILVIVGATDKGQKELIAIGRRPSRK